MPRKLTRAEVLATWRAVLEAQPEAAAAAILPTPDPVSEGSIPPTRKPPGNSASSARRPRASR